MKHLLFTAVFMSFFMFAQAQWDRGRINRVGIEDCKVTFDWGSQARILTLSGDVRVVTNPKEEATFNVMVVDSFPTLTVEIIEWPSQCGEWKWVEENEYFSIRFVKNEDEADFTISFSETGSGSVF